MQGPHDPRAALPDVRVQRGGLQVFLYVDVAEALAGKPLEESHARRFRAVERSPVSRPSKRQDHRKADTTGQAPCRRLFRIEEVVHAQLHEIHRAAEALDVTDILIEGLAGEDKADLPASAQKSLL
jgi:hypothetical protein